MVIYVKTLGMDSGRSLEKKFTELIHVNPEMELYLITNNINSCYSYVCPLT